MIIKVYYINMAYLYRRIMALLFLSVFFCIMLNISKPVFNTTGTVNFQMFKLYLEKAEEPEIKLPTSVGSSKSRRVSEKHLLLFY